MFWLGNRICGLVGVIRHVIRVIKKVDTATASGCKPGALWISYFLMFQAHFPVRLPCYDLPHLVLVV